MQVENIQNEFKKGDNCAQIIVKHFAKKCNIDENDFSSMCTFFGGGMMQASFCGSVSASYMVLGLLYKDNKNLLNKKIKEFQNEYDKNYKSKICKEILDADLTTKDGMKKIKKDNLFMGVCPNVVYKCIKIIEKISE